MYSKCGLNSAEHCGTIRALIWVLHVYECNLGWCSFGHLARLPQYSYGVGRSSIVIYHCSYFYYKEILKVTKLVSKWQNWEQNTKHVIPSSVLFPPQYHPVIAPIIHIHSVIHLSIHPSVIFIHPSIYSTNTQWALMWQTLFWVLKMKRCNLST